jgi:hypothetical protein
MYEKSGLKTKSAEEATDSSEAKASVKVGIKGLTGEAGLDSAHGQKSSVQTEETYKKSKIDFLHRHILDYQDLFQKLGSLSGGDGYLFLDDLYHIKRADQSKLLDYFHRIAKDHNLWLKIGTIRHRTRWYVPGDPPTGMKVGDDAEDIDLDLTLEKYALAKDFLIRILANFVDSVKLASISSFLTDGAVDRLVLASGGVARDFLSIFRRAVDVARERESKDREGKINAEDVNIAAGEYHSVKREEFRFDTLDDNATLELEFAQLRTFCLDRNNTNCFLVDKELAGSEADLIHELVDLKLIHLAKSHVTISGRRGRIYEAFMLDLSEYAGARKRRDLQMIEFWKPASKEALRKISLIFNPS